MLGRHPLMTTALYAAVSVHTLYTQQRAADYLPSGLVADVNYATTGSADSLANGLTTFNVCVSFSRKLKHRK